MITVVPLVRPEGDSEVVLDIEPAQLNPENGRIQPPR